MKKIALISMIFVSASVQAAGNFATQGTTGNFATSGRPVPIQPVRPIQPIAPIYPGHGGPVYVYPGTSYDPAPVVSSMLVQGNAQVQALKDIITSCYSAFTNERDGSFFPGTKACVTSASAQLNRLGAIVDRSVELGGQPGYADFRSAADEAMESFRRMRMDMEPVVGETEFQQWYQQAPK